MIRQGAAVDARPLTIRLQAGLSPLSIGEAELGLVRKRDLEYERLLRDILSQLITEEVS